MQTHTITHYLVGFYTTHQSDGTHIEAHCTCREKLEGAGQNEEAAMSALWTKFLKHRQDYQKTPQ
jgi:hypothetical protein